MRSIEEMVPCETLLAFPSKDVCRTAERARNVPGSAPRCPWAMDRAQAHAWGEGERRGPSWDIILPGSSLRSRQTPIRARNGEVDVDSSTSQRSHRGTLQTLLLLALHIPSTCLLLLVFGFIRSAWTAALLVMGSIGLLTGLALLWGIKQSRDPDD
jgi:hypothetical protein